MLCVICLDIHCQVLLEIIAFAWGVSHSRYDCSMLQCSDVRSGAVAFVSDVAGCGNFKLEPCQMYDKSYVILHYSIEHD